MQAIVPVASWASVWSTRSAISCPGTRSPRSRCSSRIVRASEAIAQSIPESASPAGASITQERADALARFEVLAPAKRTHRATVVEGLVHGEVDPVLALLHRRSVERALPCFGRQAAALGALPGRVVDALLDEQKLDATVR